MNIAGASNALIKNHLHLANEVDWKYNVTCERYVRFNMHRESDDEWP